MENIGQDNQRIIAIGQAKLATQQEHFYSKNYSEDPVELKLFFDGNSAISSEKLHADTLRDLLELSRNQEFTLNILPYGQYNNNVPKKINENGNMVIHEIDYTITENSAIENKITIKGLYSKFKCLFQKKDPMLEGAHPNMLVLREYGAVSFDQLSIKFTNLPQITKIKFGNDKLFLSKLTTLNLSNNNIISLDNLVSWNIPHNLTRLNLSNNLLTGNSVKSLRKCSKPGEKNMYLHVDLTGNLISPMVFQLNYRFNMFDIQFVVDAGLLKYYNKDQYSNALGGILLLAE